MKSRVICKSQNGESGNRKRGMMGTWGISVGFWGIKVGLWGIRVGTQGIMVEMQEIRVRMQGIREIICENICVYSFS